MSAGFHHQAVLYGSADELVTAVTPSLHGALDRREPVFVATSQMNAETMRGALGAVAARLEWLDSPPWHGLLGARFESLVASLAHWSRGQRPVCCISEQAPGEDLPLMLREYLRYEALFNVALAAFRSPVLCLWDRRRFSAGVLDSVRRTHPELIEDGRPVDSSHFTAPQDYLAEGDHTLELTDAGTIEGRHELVAPADLAALRRSLQSWASGWGLGPQPSADLVTATHEVAANALEHGASPVEVQYWREPAGMVCEVGDAGSWPAGTLAGYLRPATGQARGRGLWLARQLSDLVEVSARPPGTRVRLHFSHDPILA